MGAPVGPFVPVRLGNGVTPDYADAPTILAPRLPEIDTRQL